MLMSVQTPQSNAPGCIAVVAVLLYAVVGIAASAAGLSMGVILNGQKPPVESQETRSALLAFAVIALLCAIVACCLPPGCSMMHKRKRVEDESTLCRPGQERMPIRLSLACTSLAIVIGASVFVIGAYCSGKDPPAPGGAAPESVLMKRQSNGSDPKDCGGCPCELKCTWFPKADEVSTNVTARCCPRGDVSITVTGLKPGVGHNLRVLLFHSPESWSSDSRYRGQQAVTIQNIDILAKHRNPFTVTFNDLLYHKYGVMFHHDKDRDNKLDTNFLGMPREAVGATNNAKGGPLGGPKWSEGSFDLKTKSRTLKIEMWYP